MKIYALLALRVIPAVFFLGLVFGLTTSAIAAGKVTTSAWLSVAGIIVVEDEFEVESDVSLSGRIHVVSQVFELAGGEMMVGLRVNVASLQGQGDDFTEWVGVGADQFPPDPILPPNPVLVSVPFELIPLLPPSPTLPPSPITPPTVNLALFFDVDGNLLADRSRAIIGGELGGD